MPKRRTTPLKDLLLQASWSQEYLARRSGVSLRTVARVAAGATPSVDVARKLARALSKKLGRTVGIGEIVGEAPAEGVPA